MLLFWKAKLVLLAVPKTGTTALETALLPHAAAAIVAPPQKKHVPARRYKNQLAPYFEDKGAHTMELMAIIREPVDWLGSWYRYRARPEIAGSAASTSQMSFEDFVAGWLNDPEPEFARVGRQSRFVSRADGTVIVPHLFAYERLDLAVAFLEDRLNTRIDLPQRCVSPKMELSLSAATLARLRKEAAADFALWESVAH